jgi:hypothetical protein
MKWRKSSYSGADGNSACVELAHDLGVVRDSKNPDGPVLKVDVRALLTRVKE